MSVFPSKVNFVTGDILTATDVNEIGQAINLLDGAQTSGAKNRVLNSNFSVWQRGTSTSLAASTTGYVSDRWFTSTGTNQACTISRQATNDTTNLPFIQYCMRYQRNSGQTGVGGLNLTQSFESVNSIPLAGKTVTLSFYARAGANYSPASSALPFLLISGTGTDQNRGTTGYTGEAYPISSTATLTTTWQRFTATGTVAATTTELALYFNYTPTGTAGTNDYYEITGVQLEAANTASPYAPNGATYQAELAACQRYYWRSGTSQIIGGGFVTGTTTLDILVGLPVPMRVAATFATSSGTNYFYAGIGSGSASFTNTSTFFGSSVLGCQARFTGSGFTVGQGGYVISNNAAAYIEGSAEL